jgi:hypothetical protein
MQESEGDRDIPSIQSQPMPSTVDMEATRSTDTLVHDDNDLDNASRPHTSTQTCQHIQSRYQRVGIWVSESVIYTFEHMLEECNIVAYETLTTLDFYEEGKHPILAFAAKADPDTMYLHEALKQEDQAQFIEAMVKEVEAHTKHGHWEVIPKAEVPRGSPILPAVWALKHK